jgi:CheY-like chemotaxis protein
MPDQTRVQDIPVSANARQGMDCDAVRMVRCLLVDDSPDFLAAASLLLSREGMIVVGVASNGAEAVAQSRRLRPDVILVDIDLGEESGLDLVERLDRESNGHPVRTILISTHAEQDYHDLIVRSPALGFVTKVTLSARAIADLLGDAATGAPGTTGTPGT